MHVTPFSLMLIGLACLALHLAGSAPDGGCAASCKGGITL